MQVATLAGGCFWCLEAVYLRVRGVTQVVSGYMGGRLENPSYREVCDGDSGHAEVVQITFDPAVVRYEDLLEVFFTIHDPTTLNRQGNDVGTQYRSAIFYHDAAQEEAARRAVAAKAAGYSDPIVTRIVPAERFWPAEDYHQDYFARNSNQPYCAFVVAPKVAKLLKKHADMVGG